MACSKEWTLSNAVRAARRSGYTRQVARIRNKNGWVGLTSRARALYARAMPHDTSLIGTIVAGLGVAFLLGALAHRLKISPLAGYLLAGTLVDRKSVVEGKRGSVCVNMGV